MEVGDVWVAKIPAAFANTVRMPDGERVMNQELNWHLQNVGNEASEFVSLFARFDPAGLSEGVLAGLRTTKWESSSLERRPKA